MTHGFYVNLIILGKLWMSYNSLANSFTLEIYIHNRELFISIGRVRVIYTPPWYEREGAGRL